MLLTARAVVEQHLDVVDDERAAVLVGGLLQLAADVPKAVDDRVPLLLRKVQRLAHFVGEEGVAADVAPELRAAQQVGMEEQRPPLGLELHAPVVDADALPRCQADERPLLIVVGAASVGQVAAPYLLEEDGVEAEAEADVLRHPALREVDDADLRVERLHVQQVVVLPDLIQAHDLIHGLCRFLQK